MELLRRKDWPLLFFASSISFTMLHWLAQTTVPMLLLILCVHFLKTGTDLWRFQRHLEQVFRPAMFRQLGWNVPDQVPFLGWFVSEKFHSKCLHEKAGGKNSIAFFSIFLKYTSSVLTFKSEGKPLSGSSKNRFPSPEGGWDGGWGWWQGRSRAQSWPARAQSHSPWVRGAERVQWQEPSLTKSPDDQPSP